MLVLSRRPQGQIQIGDNITVTILEVRGKVVRVGITAPPHVEIHRAELTNWIPQTEGESNGS